MRVISKSKQPRKQRKGRYQSPLNIKQKLMSSCLDKSLRTEYNKRNTSVIKGDTVKVLRGDSKGKEGVVSKVNLKRNVLYIEGITTTKANGSEILKPIHPSNVMIIKFDMKDKTRDYRIRRK